MKINFYNPKKNNKFDSGYLNIAFSINQVDSLDETKHKYFSKEGHEFVAINSHKFRKSYIENYEKELIRISDETFFITFAYWSHFYINFILIWIFVINKIFEEHEISEVIINDIFTNDQTQNTFENLFCNVVESYIKQNSQKINIRIIGANKKESFISKFKPYLEEIIQTSINKIMLLVFSLFTKTKKNKKIVIFSEDSYNLSFLQSEISKKNINFFPIFLNIPRNKILKSLKLAILGKQFFFLQKNRNYQDLSFVSTIEIFLKKFSKKECDEIDLKGVNLQSLFNEHFEEFIAQKMSGILSSKKIIKKIFNIHTPEFAISQHALGFSHYLGKICSDHDIKSLLISHGTMSFSEKDTIANDEWQIHSRTIFNANYSHIAIQSPMMKEFFQHQKNIFSRPLITGPLLYGNNQLFKTKNFNNYLYELKKNSVKIVVHAGTPKDDTGFRPWIYESNEEYVSNINDLISAIDNLRNVFLVIRFRPTSTLNESSLKKLIRYSKNYRIHSEGSFEDFLSIADLMVSYSSSTIEEALYNKVPVLLYDSHKKYCHFDSFLSRVTKNPKPLCYCNERQELSNSIDKALTTSDWRFDNFRYDRDNDLTWLNNLI